MTLQNIHLSAGELEIVKAILTDILRGGEKVSVFGSRAKGTHRATSDLDLAVDGGGPITMATRAALEFAFSESALPYRVDIIDLATVDRRFRQAIASESLALDY
jgi:predicted nucleotidyltransferase